MKGYELLKAISDREIEDGTKIEIKGRFTGDLSGSYFIYNKGCFRFPIYEPDGTKYSDSVEIHDLINYSFEVIEENKEIKENKEIETINAYKLLEEPYLSDCFKREKFDEATKMLKQSELEIVEVVNNLVYAVKELNKEREEK